MYRNSVLLPQSAAEITSESSQLRPDDFEKAGYVSVWAMDINCEVIMAVGADIWLWSLFLSRSWGQTIIHLNCIIWSVSYSQTRFFLSVLLIAAFCSIALLFFAISNSFLLMRRLYTTMVTMGRNFMRS